MHQNAHLLCTENHSCQTEDTALFHPTLSTLHYTLSHITPARMLLLEAKVRSEGC